MSERVSAVLEGARAVPIGHSKSDDPNSSGRLRSLAASVPVGNRVREREIGEPAASPWRHQDRAGCTAMCALSSPLLSWLPLVVDRSTRPLKFGVGSVIAESKSCAALAPIDWSAAAIAHLHRTTLLPHSLAAHLRHERVARALPHRHGRRRRHRRAALNSRRRRSRAWCHWLSGHGRSTRR